MRCDPGAAGMTVVECAIAFNASGWLAPARVAIDGASAASCVVACVCGRRASVFTSIGAALEVRAGLVREGTTATGVVTWSGATSSAADVLAGRAKRFVISTGACEGSVVGVVAVLLGAGAGAGSAAPKSGGGGCSGPAVAVVAAAGLWS